MGYFINNFTEILEISSIMCKGFKNFCLKFLVTIYNFV